MRVRPPLVAQNKRLNKMEKIFNHKSDCAQHNEPYMQNGPCDCGADSKNLGWLVYASNLEYINDDIIKAYVAGVEFKPRVTFETEYQLEQFRLIEPDNFDKYHQKYKGTPIGEHTANQMLLLINQMEREIKANANFVDIK